MQCIYVEWEDASGVDSTNGWVSIDTAEPAEPRMFRQVGFVHHIDPWAVVLTEAHSPNEMSPRTRIPLGMIRRWVDLDPYVKAD